MEPRARVAVVGVGQSKRNYVHHKKRGWKHMVVEAAYEALKDAHMEAREIDGGVVNYHGEAYMGYGGIGPTLADELGMIPVAFMPIVAQCTGGGVSALAGWSQVASGLRKRILCITFDGEDTVGLTDNYNLSDDTDWDYMAGLGHIEAHLVREQAYYRKYNYDLRVVAKWVQQCYWYANRNPRAARFKDPPPPTEDLTDALIPGTNIPSIRALSNRTVGTQGGAAFVLVPEEDAGSYSTAPVYVDGVEYGASPTLFSKNYHYPKQAIEEYDITALSATHWAAKQAYRMAGVTPEEVDLAQVYTPAVGAMTLEALQICPLGKGGQFVLDGETAVDGKCPTSTDGGVCASSLSSGADVGDMIIESVHQLRRDVQLSSRQVEGAEIAVCAGYQAVGSGSTATVLTTRSRR